MRDAPLAHAYTNWDPESDSHSYGKSDWDPNRAASSHTDPEAASHTGAAPDSAVDEAVLGCQLSVNYSATLTTALAFLCIAGTALEVIFVSPCECQGFHGKNRWVAKTDLTPVPLDKSAIQSVTPSQIYAWEGLGPNVDLTGYTEARMPSEQKWYALTDRVVDAKVEADGDIHIALTDATGNNVGTVGAEIPVGPKWCDIRQTVFGWTTQKFPSNVKTAHGLKIREQHVITVTGKAFYDIGHAPADHSNRRSTPKGYAVWEIHPVMKMEVMQ